MGKLDHPTEHQHRPDSAHDMKESLRTLIAKEKNYINKFKLHHKATFAFLVFFGINLLWYGMWAVVSDIPFLNNPIVALITGGIILIVTGYFYDNLVSADFDKKRRKRKEAVKSESLKGTDSL